MLGALKTIFFYLNVNETDHIILLAHLMKTLFFRNNICPYAIAEHKTIVDLLKTAIFAYS